MLPVFVDIFNTVQEFPTKERENHFKRHTSLLTPSFHWGVLGEMSKFGQVWILHDRVFVQK